MDIANKRVLHIIACSDRVDTSRVVELLATMTDATAAVACGIGGQLSPRLKAEGIDVFEQPALQRSINPMTDMQAFLDLYRLLRHESFDLVHCHATKAGLLGRLAANATDTPVVFTVHGWGFKHTEYNRFAPVLAHGERALARITDEIVCASENEFEEGYKRGIVGLDTPVLHNGIPPIELSDDRTTLHETAGINTETPIVGAVARLTPQKAPLEILRTGHTLQERGHDVATVLIGDGPLREECEQYIEQHDFNAHILEFHKQKLELLADIDVFMLPSRAEEFPLSVLECLHLGVPIVAYDAGGVSEAINDGETGFVVASEDRVRFANRVGKLVDDHELRATMGQRAKAVAASKFTADRMVANYEHTYLRCLRLSTDKDSSAQKSISK